MVCECRRNVVSRRGSCRRQLCAADSRLLALPHLPDAWNAEPYLCPPPPPPAQTNFFFGGVDNLRWRKPVVPGDVLVRGLAGRGG